MWLAGMQEPDFRTISDFRKARVGDTKRLFQQVLDVCVQLGMVKCGKINLDGTKIEANSGKHKLTFRKTLEKRKIGCREEVEQILKEAEEIDAEEDALYGDQDGYSLPRSYTPNLGWLVIFGQPQFASRSAEQIGGEKPFGMQKPNFGLNPGQI